MPAHYMVCVFFLVSKTILVYFLLHFPCFEVKIHIVIADAVGDVEDIY
jgi:hypothetical protein